MSYRGSYAADPGGLTRQLFTDIFNNFRFEDANFEGECNQRLPKANTVLKAVKSSEDNWPNLRPLGRAHERDERTKIPSTGRSEIPDD